MEWEQFERNKEIAEIYKLLEENATKKIYKNGVCEIKCNKGLWSVVSPNEEIAESEAFHYFCQYLNDGEYDG